jgi:hypothetical protein
MRLNADGFALIAADAPERSASIIAQQAHRRLLSLNGIHVSARALTAVYVLTRRFANILWSELRGPLLPSHLRG